jgi:putative ABC transport system permease protein
MAEAAWRRYLRFWRPSVDADVDDELRFHFDERVAALIADGLTSEEARQAAEREFGDVAAIRSGLREIDRRVQANRGRAARWEQWRQDFAYSARGLRRAPGLSLTVILTLALGIGVNASLFTLLDRVFLRMPSGVARPAELRRLYWMGRSLDNAPAAFAHFSIPVAEAVSQSLRGLATTTTYRWDTEKFGDEPEATTVVTQAGPQYFTVLGVRPAFGRFFAPEEERLDVVPTVAIVSQRFWARRFGGSPADGIGQQIVLDRQRYTIIGVAPRDFTGVDLDATDVWVPLGAMGAFYGPPRGTPWYQERHLLAFQLLARPLGTRDDAQLEARATIGARRGYAGDSWRRNTTALSGPVLAARGPEAPHQEVSISIRLGAVAVIVLLIACANVANLLLADSVRRRREIAVRSALGIGRTGIVRLFLAQSLLMAAAAGIAALVVATWSGALLRALLFPDVHWSTGVIDWRVTVFTLLVTLLAGLAAGLAPALRASSTDVSQTLKSGGREGSPQRSRTRTALVIVQTALSTVLLVGAVLFVKSLHAIRALDIGFDAQRLVFVALHRPNVAQRGNAAALAVEVREVAATLAHVPGVEGVALSNMLPMYSFSFTQLFKENGDSLPNLGDGAPGTQAVSPEFFAATGVRLLRGRGLTAQDAEAGHVAVANEALARSTWPHEDALGQCIRVAIKTAPCTRIVGIVEDSRRSQLLEPTVRQLYNPLPATGPDALGIIIVRVPPARAAAVELAARREIAAHHAGASLEVHRMADILAPQYRPWELGATLFTVFGMLALVVAAIGVFSTLSHDIGQRRHELGVRAALGAGVADIVGLVMGGGVRLVAIGAVLGLALAIVASRLVASLLYGVAPRDPGTFVVVVTVLLAVAALASALPAWRATRADPLDALRAE